MQKKLDVHQAIADQIIAAIEAGAGTWQLPWHRTGEGLNRPVNIDTGNHYRGVKVIALWASAQMRGFSTGTWGTYRQWANRKADGLYSRTPPHKPYVLESGATNRMLNPR